MDKTATQKIKKEKAQKPQYNLWQNCVYMISLAWKRKKSVLWICLILAALGVAANLLGLFITPAILGNIESAVPLNVLIRTILLYAAALMLVSAANTYFSTNMNFGRLEVNLILDSFVRDKVSTTSYPNTEDQDVRRKLDRAHMSVSDNSSWEGGIWYTFTELMRNSAGLIIYIFLLTMIDPVIVAVVLVMAIAGFFVGRHIHGWGYRHRDEESEYSRRMNYISETSEDYTIAKDIRIFGMRIWLEDIYRSALRLYQSFIARRERTYIWANVIDVILLFLRNGVAYIYLIHMVLANGLPASQFVLYFSVVGGFSAWVSGILSGFLTLHIQGLNISAVREFLEYAEPFRFEDGEPLEPDADKPCQIELRNVSFRHPGADKDTLKHINLTIKAGEKLAIVGLNGAGKTTLIKLACGFYDPTEGEILLNGENITKYNRRDYYRHFSAVFQDFSLLSATIAENIAQTHNPEDMEKVIICAEKSGLAAKINSLPQKYDTHTGKGVYEDGIELSGGEIQRLMLTRALYKDAPIIILDEPTAAMDPIAENDIYNKYNDLTGRRTSVYISHRLASTRFCDRIIFIDNGSIIEDGTHETLIKQDGKYAELFEIQSRYYREGVSF